MRWPRTSERSGPKKKAHEQDNGNCGVKSSVSAMQDVVGANVLAQDLRPVLVRVRSSMMELVDGVTSDHYKRLDRWMSVEHKAWTGG